jgi:ferrous iron transport protein A
MEKALRMSSMVKGKTYLVCGFAQGESEYSEKLNKMGFVIGTMVELAPVKIADPIVIQVRGSRIALRKNEAHEVMVEESSNA